MFSSCTLRMAMRFTRGRLLVRICIPSVDNSFILFFWSAIPKALRSWQYRWFGFGLNELRMREGGSCLLERIPPLRPTGWRG